MGLDSVDLLMNFEKKFKVDIPGLEAEKMTTVEDAANGFLKYLTLETPERKIFETVFEKLNETLKELGWIKSDLHQDTIVQSFIPSDNQKGNWLILHEKLSMKIPVRKFLGIPLDSFSSRIKENTSSRFVDCICALNHEELIDAKHLTSKYEVIAIIMGITSERCAIPIDKIFPSSRFTKDLGIE